jgi:hypothetical protein
VRVVRVVRVLLDPMGGIRVEGRWGWGTFTTFTEEGIARDIKGLLVNVARNVAKGC